MRLASTRSLPPALSWRTSPASANHTRPARVTATPRKLSGSSSRRSTTHASDSSRAANSITGPGPSTSSSSRRAPAAGAPAGGCPPARPATGWAAGQQHRAPVGAHLVEQRLGALEALRERGVEPSPEYRGERQLEPVRDAQLLAEGGGAVRAAGAGVVAQELVDGGELGLQPLALAARLACALLAARQPLARVRQLLLAALHRLAQQRALLIQALQQLTLAGERLA